ncbi:MAG: DUF2613 family protein [Candidatus Spechtbacterales bacterium]
MQYLLSYRRYLLGAVLGITVGVVGVWGVVALFGNTTTPENNQDTLQEPLDATG